MSGKLRLERSSIDPDPYEPLRLALGYRLGDLPVSSGQTAIDERGRVLGVSDFDGRAEQVFSNLKRVLQAGGSSRAKVVAAAPDAGERV